MRNETKRMKAG